VPTAASMNGYTSTIAAVLQNGVKRTLACHQPIAIFADTRIVCEAPLHLNQAGFGDLLSKPFSNADWLLSHFVRDVHYDGAASAFLDAPFNQLLAHAKGIAIADPEAIERLLETLLLSGFSMALAGSSAPASGGEHLLSHYWDMEQHAHGDELRGLHGTQVGIATWTSALLYERLLALPAEDLLHAFVPRPTRPTFDEVRGSHPGLNDAICREVHAQFHAKQKAEPEQAAELRRLQSDWPRIRTALKASCLPAGRIEEALRDAGCAMKASDLGVDRAHFVRTVVHARQIRHRYVALDLLADLGLLAAWAEDVVDHIEGAHA
jgi:glycerol-1-phosphate dehydrogenase [NAD(P)+]